MDLAWQLCPLIASLPTVPHCSTSIHTAMQALGITLEPEPPALPSTRNRLRTAMRRGAAWPPAERPSSCVAVQPAVSRWQIPHRRAVMVADRRVCRPQQHGSPSQRCRGTRISGCPPCLGRPVRVHMSSVRPSSVRRPVRVQRPRAWCPRVRCPVPGVRVQCERPASVSTLSAPVSSWSAWVRQAATRLGTGRSGNYLTHGSLSPV
jgi:hypothetical protein